MAKLTKEAIKRPVMVIVTLIGLILFSIVSVMDMQLKLMPDINVPVLVVSAVYPGASPEEVDEQVMEKIREACAMTSGLKTATTNSYENYGVLAMQFNYGTDISSVHDDVRGYLESVEPSLPDDVDTPTILEIDFEAIDDMSLSVSADADDLDIRSLVDDELTPELRKASALADITSTGGDENYISVKIIPEYAEQYGVNASTLASAIKELNYSMPVGSVDYGDQTINVESEIKLNTIEKLEQIPVSTAMGQTIHLNDIAEISYAVSDKNELARYNGNDSVSIGLKRKQSSTAVTLSRQVKQVIENFEKSHPEVRIELIYDSADEIVNTLFSVARTLVLGIILAMAVIFLFFGDIKGSLIVGSTMPIALLAALVCMNFAGISLNVVSLNGLVLSIGMITDNAVVVIEMCFRKQEEGLSFAEAAYEGTKKVVGSVVGSTITTVIVYLPLSFLEGLGGQFFKQLGFTIVFVLIASLISAVVFVPFFFSIYHPTERKNNPVTAVIKVIAEYYGRLLKKLLNRRVFVVISAVGLFVLSMVIASTMRSELIAATDEGIIQMSVAFRPNTDLATMNSEVERIESFVNESGLVDDVIVTVSEASSSASVMAYKKDDEPTATLKIVDQWNEALAGFSDICEVTVESGSSDMSGSMTSGGSEEIDLNADDMDALRDAADKVVAVFEDTPGVLSVTSSVGETGSKLMIDVDPELARANGFSAATVSQLIYLNMNGADAGEVTIDKDKYDIKVEYPREYYTDIPSVESMSFMNTSGNRVYLSEIADVSFAQASQAVTREEGRYSAAITAYMTVETKDGIMDEVRPKLDEIELGEGVEYSDNALTVMMDEEFAAIGRAIMIAFYLVFMVMAIQFESIVYSILIMLCIPFAAIGSILLMWFMDVKISMTVLLGVLMLAGIVVNNGIIYIDTVNQMREEGMAIRDALVLAGKDRLRPILITTLTTELSMLPVAFKLAKNSETMQGMAVVIVGGLLASTLLTLLLLPTFYLMFEKFKKRRANK